MQYILYEWEKEMKKKIIAAIIIIIVITSAAAAAVWMREPKKEQQTSNMVEDSANKVSKLPSIKIYHGEEQTGTLTGYITKMNTALMRDNLMIADADERVIKIAFTAEEVTVISAKYEVKSYDGDRLIDNGEIDGFAQETKDVEGSIPVSSILENNKEYSLTITLDTKELGELCYYSRIMVVAEDFVTGQIQFAKKFSNDTMDGDAAAALAVYLEPDAEMSNNNLGKVTLSNNYDLLTWGNLSPAKVGENDIQLKEVYVKDTGVSGTYQMTYQVEAQGNNEVMDKYDIVETITVWTFQDQQYVLAYERDMNQVWTADENTVGRSSLNLGIQSDTDIHYQQSKNGTYITYVANDSLWLLHTEEKKFTKLYVLSKEQKQKTKILISKVDEEGNVDFIVCGYCIDKAHIGMNGISVRHYDRKNNTVEEKIFLPYDQPAEILAGQVGELCYMNDNVLYLMIGHNINYVNLVTKETGVITDKLEAGNYVINEDKDTIAYNTNGSIYNSDSITVSNFSNGTSQVIEAGEGNKIKVCGYSKNNLVYGVAAESQINTKKGKNIFNMTSITILNKELEEISSYAKENVYISDVEVTDTVIHLKRIQKKQPIDDDQLIDNTENMESIASSSYYDDTRKYRELALSLKKTFSSSLKVVINDTPQKNIGAQTVEFERQESILDAYYVYASGRLKGIFDNQSSAEQAGKEEKGLVTDYTGQKIWTFEENYD